MAGRVKTVARFEEIKRYNDTLQEEMMEYFIKFRPNPTGTPHLNGKVERGHKTDKEEIYSTLHLKDRKLKLHQQLAEWQD